jgi:hypothetical protein
MKSSFLLAEDFASRPRMLLMIEAAFDGALDGALDTGGGDGEDSMASEW